MGRVAPPGSVEFTVRVTIRVAVFRPEGAEAEIVVAGGAANELFFLGDNKSGAVLRGAIAEKEVDLAGGEVSGVVSGRYARYSSEV